MLLALVAYGLVCMLHRLCTAAQALVDSPLCRTPEDGIAAAGAAVATCSAGIHSPPPPRALLAAAVAHGIAGAAAATSDEGGAAGVESLTTRPQTVFVTKSGTWHTSSRCSHLRGASTLEEVPLTSDTRKILILVGSAACKMCKKES